MRRVDKFTFRCIICKKSFERYPRQIEREPNRGKCCSNICRIEYTKNEIKKICQYCGKEFFVHPSNLKQSPLKFCSIRCWKNDNRIEVMCAVCGKKFLSYKSRIRKVCSTICRSKNNEGDKNGMRKISPDKTPNWRGGISPNPYPKEWNKSLKKLIRKKQNGMCGLCCSNGHVKTLHIHHIDYNKNNCTEVNLIGLCKNCHSKTNHNRDFWINFFTKKVDCTSLLEFFGVLKKNVRTKP